VLKVAVFFLRHINFRAIIYRKAGIANNDQCLFLINEPSVDNVGLSIIPIFLLDQNRIVRANYFLKK